QEHAEPAVRQVPREGLGLLAGRDVLAGMDDRGRRLDLRQARPVVERHHRLTLPPQRPTRAPVLGVSPREALRDRRPGRRLPELRGEEHPEEGAGVVRGDGRQEIARFVEWLFELLTPLGVPDRVIAYVGDLMSLYV